MGHDLAVLYVLYITSQLTRNQAAVQRREDDVRAAAYAGSAFRERLRGLLDGSRTAETSTLGEQVAAASMVSKNN